MITTPKESKPVNNQISSEDYIVHTNLQGVILCANDFFLQSLGLPLKKILHQPLVSYLSVKDVVFPVPGFEAFFTHTASFEFQSIIPGIKKDITELYSFI